MRDNQNSRSGQGRRERTKRLAAEVGVGHRQARKPRSNNITVIHPGHDAALYQRSPGQHRPEPVFTYVDLQERRIWAAIGRAWEPRDHDDPAVRRYQLGGDLEYGTGVPTADAAFEFMRGPLEPNPYAGVLSREPSLPQLVSRMAAEYRPVRTPNGRCEFELNRAARRAEDKLRRRIERAVFFGLEEVGAWSPDATSIGYDRAYGITAATTDDELDAIEAEIRHDSGPENTPEWNILVWDGLWEHLVELRDGLAADGEAA